MYMLVELPYNETPVARSGQDRYLEQWNLHQHADSHPREVQFSAMSFAIALMLIEMPSNHL